MFFLAAYYVLLSRWSGQNDLVVGVPVAGRDRTELKSIMGLFIATLPLRAEVKESERFVVFLDSIKRMFLRGVEHQRYSLDRLAQRLGIAADPSRSSFLDAVFLFQNIASAAFRLPGLEVQPHLAELNVAKHDLKLIISEEGGAIRYSIEYATSLFSAATIDRLARYYCAIIDQVVATPNVEIGDLRLGTTEELTGLVENFNEDWDKDVFGVEAASFASPGLSRG